MGKSLGSSFKMFEQLDEAVFDAPAAEEESKSPLSPDGAELASPDPSTRGYSVMCKS